MRIRRNRSNFKCKCLSILSASVAVISFDPLPVNAGPTTQPATTAPSGSSAIARATQDAIVRLYLDVRREEISSNFRTAELIDALGAESEVLDVLSQARQIGAPRAIAVDAVQIWFEINGAKVSQTLVSAAVAKADRSPVAPKKLQSMMSNWDQKTFIAVGSSLGEFADASIQPVADGSQRTSLGGSIGTFEPPGSGFRSNMIQGTPGAISSDRRIELEDAARRDAAERFVDHLKQDSNLERLGLNRILEDRSKRSALVEQVAHSKAELVDVSQYSMRVELQLDSEAIAHQIEALIASPVPDDLVDLVSSHAPVAIGFASSPFDEAGATGFIAPAWSADPVGAEALSNSVGTPLQTARTAERAARSALAEKILALKVDDVHTIQDVALQDEVIRLRLESLVSDAPLAGIDYEAGGAVRVRISVDGSRIWAALVAD